MSTPAAIRPHLWSRQEYDRMVEAGVFAPGSRVQLIEGEIVEIPPQGSLHATAISLVEDALRRMCPEGLYLRTRMPIALDLRSEPEPDAALVRGSPRDFAQAHPATVELAIEVADTTVSFDRGRKRALYARNGVPEYWILNVAEGCLEVYRQPEGEAYRVAQVLRPPETVSPLACPRSAIPVDDLLP
jgi:Uma2 family endonuclease